MVLGQCVQQLLDRMKQDVIWTTVATSYDPLQLISIVEKTVLAETEDQYPFAIVYEQELSLYGFHQNTMTNDQWYERFNTKVDVGTSIGVTRQNSIILEWTTQSYTAHLIKASQMTRRLKFKQIQRKGTSHTSS